jgi:hypothetical protein
MRRRKFIGLLGGATAAWPLGALAQQRDRPRRIGVLMGFAETDEVWQTYLRVFRERLRDFGWMDTEDAPETPSFVTITVCAKARAISRYSPQCVGVAPSSQQDELATFWSGAI